ncbi:MAG TPA: hypothetical protein VHF24_09090 [Acidimicrobiales bacterium]|nr:hypothetical protein [Acidimicrobiales bacterium]
MPGLIILTVATRVAGGGSVSTGSVLGIVGVAPGFPFSPGSSAAGRRGPSSTLGGDARDHRLAFALAFAVLAEAAKLAPSSGRSWPAAAASGWRRPSIPAFRRCPTAPCARPSSARPRRSERALEDAIGRPQAGEPVPDAKDAFEVEASPWYTLCEVRAADRPGVPHALAVAFAHARAHVHTARVTTVGGEAVDRVELTDGSGCKLDANVEESIPQALATACRPARGRWRIAQLSGGGKRPAASRPAAAPPIEPEPEPASPRVQPKL